MTTFIKERDGTPKHYCKTCNCWVDARKKSLRVHEEGKKHKENAAKKIKQMHATKRKNRIEEENREGQFLGINLAAINAYAGDMKNGIAGHSAEFEALRTSVLKSGKPKPGSDIASIYDMHSAPSGGVDYVAKYNKEYGHQETETVIVPGALPPGLYEEYGDAVGASLEHFKLDTIKDSIARKAKEAWDKVKAERKAEEAEKQRVADEEKQRIEQIKHEKRVAREIAKMKAPPGMKKSKPGEEDSTPAVDWSQFSEIEAEMLRNIQGKVQEIQQQRRESKRKKAKTEGGGEGRDKTEQGEGGGDGESTSVKDEEQEWMEAFEEWESTVKDEEISDDDKDPAATITDADEFRKEHPEGEIDEETGMGGWISVQPENTVLDATTVTPLSDIRRANRRARENKTPRQIKEDEEAEKEAENKKKRIAKRKTAPGAAADASDDEETVVDNETELGILPQGISSILAKPKAPVEEEPPADESELAGIKFKKKKAKDKPLRRPTA